MRKVLLAAAALSAGMITAPALAAPVITFTQNVYSLPPGTDYRIIQDFQSHPDGGAPYVPDPGETVSGNVRVFSNTVPNTAVDPAPGDGDHYLSIINGSYSVSLGEPSQLFSFVLGSLDNYNNLRLTFADGSAIDYAGRQIIGDSGSGPYNSATSGRVSYNAGTGPRITGAIFSSGTAAFEIDGLAASAPEPATWGTLILGVGMIGTALRRRRPVVQLA